MLEDLFVAIAGFVGGFVSTLASNGSSVTLPALELFGLSEHVATGTNRLSVLALGLVGTISFARRGLIDWRKGAWIAASIALGTGVGSLITVESSDAVLDVIVISGLVVVLGMILARPGRWLRGREGALKPFGWGQAAVYFVIGVYAGLVVLGSGFFMLAALVMLTGCDLREGNAMKAFILARRRPAEPPDLRRQRRGRLGRRHTSRARQRRRRVLCGEAGLQELGQGMGLPLPRARGHPIYRVPDRGR